MCVGRWIWLPAGALWARPAICGALDRASVNSDAANQRSPNDVDPFYREVPEPQEHHTQEGSAKSNATTRRKVPSTHCAGTAVRRGGLLKTQAKRSTSDDSKMALRNPAAVRVPHPGVGGTVVSSVIVSTAAANTSLDSGELVTGTLASK